MCLGFLEIGALEFGVGSLTEGLFVTPSPCLAFVSYLVPPALEVGTPMSLRAFV